MLKITLSTLAVISLMFAVHMNIGKSTAGNESVHAARGHNWVGIAAILYWMSLSA